MKNILYIILILITVGCNPIPFHQKCNLPKLITDLPIKPIKVVSTNSYFNNECPNEIAQRFDILRDWGSIQMERWGSPHRLWMSAISQKGERLKIDGPTVESRTANLSECFDSVITFGGQSYVEKEVATTFTIEIHSLSDQVLETLHFGYDTEKCICAEYDSI